MATATWHTPLHATHPPANPHGTKRRATDDLDNAQRLAKRFHLLNIDTRGKLWNQLQAQHRSHQSHPNHAPRSDELPRRASYTLDASEHMQVEDTKDRVYISNLDDELASISEDEDEKRLIFLPDIERHLNRVTKSVMTGERPEGLGKGELVLYSVPRALSVPEDKDSVRKAIIETRARAREQTPAAASVQVGHDAMLHDGDSHGDHDMAIDDGAGDRTVDEDAMDLG